MWDRQLARPDEDVASPPLVPEAFERVDGAAVHPTVSGA
jgi:hypothetical protein